MLRDPLIHAMGGKLVESSLRQRVLAHNIANAETPRFKAFRLTFADAQAKAAGSDGPLALSQTHPAHLPGERADSLAAATGARLIRDTATSMRNDGNNVDLDRELAELSANQLYYATVSTLIRNRFSGYDRIISGRAG